MKLLKLLFILLLMSWNSYPREPKGCLSMAQNRIVEGQKVVQCYKLPDEVGNLYKSWLRNDRKYGKNGQLLADQNWRYHYDDEGNLIEKENGQTAWQYHWYASGMLAKITKPNGIEVQYQYDALGRRTAKIVHDKITRYCWDGNVLLHEFDYNLEERPTHVLDEDGFIVLSHPEPVNNLVTWIYDNGSFVPSAKIVDDKKYSILSDYIGRPAQAYNEEGEIVWEAQYDIYGKITKLKGDKTFVPFRQLGQYEDSETPDLYYNRFRFYDCETGLYISQDPIGLLGNNPTMYGYVKDSNAKVDIFGLNECTKYGPNDGAKLEDDIEQALRNNGIDFTRGRKVGIKGEIDFETSTHIIEATVSNGGKLKQIKKYKTEEFNPEGKQIILVGPNYTNKAAIKDIQGEGAQVVHNIEDMLGLIK